VCTTARSVSATAFCTPRAERSPSRRLHVGAITPQRRLGRTRISQRPGAKCRGTSHSLSGPPTVPCANVLRFCLCSLVKNRGVNRPQVGQDAKTCLSGSTYVHLGWFMLYLYRQSPREPRVAPQSCGPHSAVTLPLYTLLACPAGAGRTHTFLTTRNRPSSPPLSATNLMQHMHGGGERRGRRICVRRQGWGRGLRRGTHLTRSCAASKDGNVLKSGARPWRSMSMREGVRYRPTVSTIPEPSLSSYTDCVHAPLPPPSSEPYRNTSPQPHETQPHMHARLRRL